MALKILLADDSMTAQNMGKKILTDAGYEVVAVSNGAAAVKRIAEINPHLCILDIYMPGYTGLEVCEKIKTSSVTSRMPVLLTVGKMEPYKPEEGARVRADGVIVKPFEASELLRAVHRFSQRIAGHTNAPGRTPAPSPPSPPPASTPATYERTVKLTREQIQEYMDPTLRNWKGGTVGPDVPASPAARTEIPAEMGMVSGLNVESLVATTQTASTADAMPSFAVATVTEEVVPPITEAAAMVDLDTRSLPVKKIQESITVRRSWRDEESSLPNASAVLPGFVDYLLSHASTSAMEILDRADEVAAELSSVPIVVPAAFRFQPGEPVYDEIEPVYDEIDDPAPPNGFGAHSIGYEIPAIDPALEVTPAVSIRATPDPQFEPPQDLPVANATEEGLQPTSRAPESDGVVTPTDPNLAPMGGLIDAVQPLEGGRLVVPEEVSVAPDPVVEADPEAPSVAPLPVSPVIAEEPRAETPEIEKPAPKKSKKGKEMRPVPPSAVAESPQSLQETAPAASKSDVTEEIAAVLNLLGQTTSAVIPAIPTENMDPQAAEEIAAPTRVWMAEEVALSDVEAMLSLENEMQLAQASKIGEPVASSEPVMGSTASRARQSESDVATALAEEPVRDDKIAPKSAIPDSGGLPPGSGASPTQELAAAMAAAFGGALPQEDLARAEETQSISEEVRRFALGDAYKPKPGFGGAAIDDPEEKVVDPKKLAAAVGRALDRLKPQLVAEILKELENGEKQ